MLLGTYKFKSFVGRNTLSSALSSPLRPDCVHSCAVLPTTSMAASRNFPPRSITQSISLVLCLLWMGVLFFAVPSGGSDSSHEADEQRYVFGEESMSPTTWSSLPLNEWHSQPAKHTQLDLFTSKMKQFSQLYPRFHTRKLWQRSSRQQHLVSASFGLPESPGASARRLQTRQRKMILGSTVFVFVDPTAGNDSSCAPCRTVAAAVDFAWSASASSSWWTKPAVSLIPGQPALQAPRAYIIVRKPAVDGASVDPLLSSVLLSATHSTAVLAHISFQCLPTAEFQHVHSLYRFIAAEKARSGTSSITCPSTGYYILGQLHTGLVASADVTGLAAGVNSGLSAGMRLQPGNTMAASGNIPSVTYMTAEMYGWVNGAGARFTDTKYGGAAARCAWSGPHSASALAASRAHTVQMPSSTSPLDSPLHVLQANGLASTAQLPFGVPVSDSGHTCAAAGAYSTLFVDMPIAFPSVDQATSMLALPPELSGLVFLNPTQCASGIVDGVLRDAGGDIDGFGPMLFSAAPGLPWANAITVEISGFHMEAVHVSGGAQLGSSLAVLQALGIESLDPPGSPAVAQGSVSLCGTRLVIHNTSSALSGGWLSVSDGAGVAVLASQSSATASSGAGGGFVSAVEASTVVLGSVSILDSSALLHGGAVYVDSGARLLTASLPSMGVNNDLALHIVNSSAGADGGAVACRGASACLIRSTRMHDCSSGGSGGCIVAQSSLLRTNLTVLDGASANVAGGCLAIQNGGAVNDTGSAWMNCSAPLGGVLSAGNGDSAVLLRDSALYGLGELVPSGRMPPLEGGCIHAQSNVGVWLTNVHLSHCRASTGGAIHAQQLVRVSVDSSTILHSSCEGTGCTGGAISLNDQTQLLMLASHVADCRAMTADGRGGCIAAGQDTQVEIAHSTISHGSAFISGGCIAAWSPASLLKLFNTTVSDCRAGGSVGAVSSRGSGAGIFSAGGSVQLLGAVHVQRCVTESEAGRGGDGGAVAIIAAEGPAQSGSAGVLTPSLVVPACPTNCSSLAQGSKCIVTPQETHVYSEWGVGQHAGDANANAILHSRSARGGGLFVAGVPLFVNGSQCFQWSSISSVAVRPAVTTGSLLSTAADGVSPAVLHMQRSACLTHPELSAPTCTEGSSAGFSGGFLAGPFALVIAKNRAQNTGGGALFGEDDIQATGGSISKLTACIANWLWLEDNVSEYVGGGVAAGPMALMRLQFGRFYKNQAENGGGAVLYMGLSHPLNSLLGLDVIRNTASQGGGISWASGYFTQGGRAFSATRRRAWDLDRPFETDAHEVAQNPSVNTPTYTAAQLQADLVPYITPEYVQFLEKTVLLLPVEPPPDLPPPRPMFNIELARDGLSSRLVLIENDGHASAGGITAFNRVQMRLIGARLAVATPLEDKVIAFNIFPRVRDHEDPALRRCSPEYISLDSSRAEPDFWAPAWWLALPRYNQVQWPRRFMEDWLPKDAYTRGIPSANSTYELRFDQSKVSRSSMAPLVVSQLVSSFSWRDGSFATQLSDFVGLPSIRVPSILMPVATFVRNTAQFGGGADIVCAEFASCTVEGIVSSQASARLGASFTLSADVDGRLGHSLVQYASATAQGAVAYAAARSMSTLDAVMSQCSRCGVQGCIAFSTTGKLTITDSAFFDSKSEGGAAGLHVTGRDGHLPRVLDRLELRGTSFAQMLGGADGIGAIQFDALGHGAMDDIIVFRSLTSGSNGGAAVFCSGASQGETHLALSNSLTHFTRTVPGGGGSILVNDDCKFNVANSTFGAAAAQFGGGVLAMAGRNAHVTMHGWINMHDSNNNEMGTAVSITGIDASLDIRCSASLGGLAIENMQASLSGAAFSIRPSTVVTIHHGALVQIRNTSALGGGAMVLAGALTEEFMNSPPVLDVFGSLKFFKISSSHTSSLGVALLATTNAVVNFHPGSELICRDLSNAFAGSCLALDGPLARVTFNNATLFATRCKATDGPGVVIRDGSAVRSFNSSRFIATLNTATARGGFAAVMGGSLQSIDSAWDIVSNTAAGQGGAFFFSASLGRAATCDPKYTHCVEFSVRSQELEPAHALFNCSLNTAESGGCVHAETPPHQNGETGVVNISFSIQHTQNTQLQKTGGVYFSRNRAIAAESTAAAGIGGALTLGDSVHAAAHDVSCELNLASNGGGCMAVIGSASLLQISNSTLSNNTALQRSSSGGAVMLTGRSNVLHIRQTLIDFNSAGSIGGAVLASGGHDVSILGSSVQHNQVGGTSASCVIEDCGGAGVALRGSGLQATIQSTAFFDNIATGPMFSGGGMLAVGVQHVQLALVNMSYNAAPSGLGGGLHAKGIARFVVTDRVVIDHNIAAVAGGWSLSQTFAALCLSASAAVNYASLSSVAQAAAGSPTAWGLPQSTQSCSVRVAQNSAAESTQTFGGNSGGVLLDRSSAIATHTYITANRATSFAGLRIQGTHPESPNAHSLASVALINSSVEQNQATCSRPGLTCGPSDLQSSAFPARVVLANTTLRDNIADQISNQLDCSEQSCSVLRLARQWPHASAAGLDLPNLCASIPVTTYNVDLQTSSRSKCCGSLFKPCHNIASAIEASVSGDVISLFAGTYSGNGNENLTISKDVTIRSSSSGGWVKLHIASADFHALQGGLGQAKFNSRWLGRAVLLGTTHMPGQQHMPLLVRCEQNGNSAQNGVVWADLDATVSVDTGTELKLRELLPLCEADQLLLQLSQPGDVASPTETILQHTSGAGIFRIDGSSNPSLSLNGVQLHEVLGASAAEPASLLSCAAYPGAAGQASIRLHGVSIVNITRPPAGMALHLIQLDGCKLDMHASAVSGLRADLGSVVHGTRATMHSNHSVFMSAMGASPVLRFQDASRVWLGNASVLSNSAVTSSVLSLSTSELKLEDSVFANNHAVLARDIPGNGGVLSLASSSAIIQSVSRNVSFIHNTASNFGGAVHATLGSSVQLRSSGDVCVTFRGNMAASGGAVAVLGESHLHLQGHVELTGNSARSYGGAVYMEKSQLITSNAPAHGSVSRTGPAFSFNGADVDGGGVFALLSSVALNETSFRNNSAVRGGGIACILSSVNAVASALVGNSAASDGGALDLRTGDSLTLKRCKIRHNTAAAGGGALALNAPQLFHVEDSVFEQNVADAADGGAISLVASAISEVRLSGSLLFHHNRAGGNGGALHIQSAQAGSAACAGAAAVSGLLHSACGVSLAVGPRTNATHLALVDSSGLQLLEPIGASSAGHVGWGDLLTGCPALQSSPVEASAESEAGGGNFRTWQAAGVSIPVHGEIEFLNNVASHQGGAVYIAGVRLYVNATSNFTRNAAQELGGALSAANGAVLDMTAARAHGSSVFRRNMAGEAGSAVHIDGSSSAVLLGVAAAENCAPAKLPVSAAQDADGWHSPVWLSLLAARCTASLHSLQLAAAEEGAGAGGAEPDSTSTYAEISIGGAITSDVGASSPSMVQVLYSSVQGNVGGGITARTPSSSQLGHINLPSKVHGSAAFVRGPVCEMAVAPHLGGLYFVNSTARGNAAVTQAVPDGSVQVRALGDVLQPIGAETATATATLTSRTARQAATLTCDGRVVLPRDVVFSSRVPFSDGGGSGTAGLPAGQVQGPAVALSLGTTASHAQQAAHMPLDQSSCDSVLGSPAQQAAHVQQLCSRGNGSSCLRPGEAIPPHLSSSLLFLDASGVRTFGESIPSALRVEVSLPCPPQGSILRPGAVLASSTPLHVSRATGSASLSGLILLSFSPYWSLVHVSASGDGVVMRGVTLQVPMAPCPAGHGWSQGDCAPCPAGQVSTAEQYACERCPGNQVPQLLPDGAVSGSMCRPCPVGQVPDPSRPGSCARCLPGTQPAQDQSSCEACAPGSASPLGEQCRTCAPGFVAGNSGAVSCDPCASGLYSLPTVTREEQLGAGATAAQWRVQGGTVCTACASLAASCEQGVLRLRENLYMPELTGDVAVTPGLLTFPQDVRLTRQRGAELSNASATGVLAAEDCSAECLASQLAVLQSVAFGTTGIHLCIGPDACQPLQELPAAADIVNDTAGASSQQRTGESGGGTLGIRCGPGRKGPLCGACSTTGGSGDGFVRIGDRCTECSSGGMQVFLLFLVTLALLLLLAYTALLLRSSDENNEQQVMFKIFINHMQVLATQTSIALTAQLSTLAQVIGDVGEVSGGGVFTLSPMRCYFKEQWASLHSLQLASPFAMVLFVALLQIAFVRCGCTRFVMEREELLPTTEGGVEGGSGGGSGAASQRLTPARASGIARTSALETPSPMQQPPLSPSGGGVLASTPRASAKRRSVVAVQRGDQLVAVRQYLCGAQLPLRLKSWQELWQERGIIAPLVFVMLVTYNSLLQAGMGALRCTEAVQGGYWLVADTSVACSGTAYELLSSFSGLAVALVALAMPVAVVLLLRPHRSSLSSPRVFQRYGMLYGGYRPSRWYWESIIMLRKVFVQIIASLLTVTGLRLVSLLLVMGLCVLAQAKLKPYKEHTLNRLEMLSLGSLLFSLVLEVAVMAAVGVSANAAALDPSLQTLKNAQIPIALTIVILQLVVIGTLLVFLARASLQQVYATLCKAGSGGVLSGKRTKHSLALELASKRAASKGSHQARTIGQRRAALGASSGGSLLSPPLQQLGQAAVVRGNTSHKKQAEGMLGAHGGVSHLQGNPLHQSARHSGETPECGGGGTGGTLATRRRAAAGSNQRSNRIHSMQSKE